ncbi:hypothetical protein VPH35_116794 [Triticum aestivum]
MMALAGWLAWLGELGVFGHPVQATAGHHGGPQLRVAFPAPCLAWCLAVRGSDCYIRWLCSWSAVGGSDMAAAVLAVSGLREVRLATMCLFVDGLALVWWPCQHRRGSLRWCSEAGVKTLSWSSAMTSDGDACMRRGPS